jgi:8-oxo-dGTP pyrophosphatase MutT (NUDIX family)
MPMSPYVAAVRAKIGHDLLAATAASVSLFDQDDRILLVQLADTGLWALPGGAIDPNELPADAAVRECWEETGLLVEPTCLIGVFGGPEFLIKYPNGDVTYYTTIAFEARRLAGEERPDGSETLDLRYFSRDEINWKHVDPVSRVILQRAFLRMDKPYFAPITWSPPRR